MIYTPVCEMIGIKYPVFQGGMAHISDANLAAAVSSAGGLGIISAASGDIKALETEIDKARKLTKNPIGVNVMLQGENIDEIARVLADKKVEVITTGAGNPEKYIPMWKEAGAKVIPVIASTAFAKLVVRAGADAVIAEGGESGGHVGETNTMSLLPQVADTVSVPVIAAGGIGDGRGIAAAFMLGATGVQIGTRFLLATECNISRAYKDKVLKASDTSTIVTGKRLGHPVRSIKSPFSRGYAKAEYSDISDNDLELSAIGSLKAAVLGTDDKKACYLAGQISGMLNKEQPSEEIILEIMKEAENVLIGGTKWVK